MQRFALASRPRRLARAAVLAALALTAGCYSYVPVTATATRPGTEVLVTLVEPGASDLARFLGPRAASLEGGLVSATDSAITVSVVTVTRTTGSEETWPGDQVVVPRAAVASVQTRRLARSRSVLLTAAIIAVGALIGAGVAAGDDVNRGGPRVPGGQPR